MIRTIRATLRSESGKERANNEDNVSFNYKAMPCNIPSFKSTALEFRTMWNCIPFGVFDGMGGLRDGEVASLLAAERFTQYAKGLHFRSLNSNGPEILSRCLIKVNLDICERSRKLGYQIGTTAATAVFIQKNVLVSNVGDSPIYLFRNFRLRRLSEEHSDRELIRKLGICTTPSLTQHLGISPEKMEIEPYASTMRSFLGDRFLLCTDGLSSFVSEEQISAICKENKDLDDCADSLLHTALTNGSKDNITLILCDVTE